MAGELVVGRESSRMRRSGRVTDWVDLLQSVDALSFLVRVVHQVHFGGFCVAIEDDRVIFEDVAMSFLLEYQNGSLKSKDYIRQPSGGNLK